MKINTALIWTGENFNLVLDTLENARVAFEIAKKILVENNMHFEADNLAIDKGNNKIYITDGAIGNADELVKDICLAVAREIEKSNFYGHAYYDDMCGAYQSCADYEYEAGLLKIVMWESPEGNGFCPECEEQVVCFDEYDPDKTYVCEECGENIKNHADMFGGILPVVKKFEERIV